MAFDFVFDGGDGNGLEPLFVKRADDDLCASSSVGRERPRLGPRPADVTMLCASEFQFKMIVEFVLRAEAD